MNASHPDKDKNKSGLLRMLLAIMTISLLLAVLVIFIVTKARRPKIVIGDQPPSVEQGEPVAEAVANLKAQEVNLEKKVTGHIVCRDSADQFTLEEDDYYYLTSTYSVCETKTYLNEILIPAEQEVNTALPDRKAGEYRRLQLQRRPDGQVFLVEEERFAAQKGEFVSFSFVTPVKFLKGTWQDYQGGGLVTLEYTQKGLRELQEALEKRLRQEIESVFTDALIDEDESLLPSVAFDYQSRFNRMPNATIVASAKTVAVRENGPSDFTYMVKRKRSGQGNR